MELRDHLENARNLGLVADAECREIVRFVNRALGAATRLINYLDTAKEP